MIALFLAFSETLGKSAQTAAISYNVEAANLWAFFQAKNIRRTVVLTAAEEMKVSLASASEDGLKSARTKQVDDWQKTAARYRSEPDVREGTIELAERAKEAEHKRDTAMARYHHYEVASAAFQIGIVLASATVITGMLALTGLAGGLVVIGLVLPGDRPVCAARGALVLNLVSRTRSSAKRCCACGTVPRFPHRSIRSRVCVAPRSLRFGAWIGIHAFASWRGARGTQLTPSVQAHARAAAATRGGA